MINPESLNLDDMDQYEPDLSDPQILQSYIQLIFMQSNTYLDNINETDQESLLIGYGCDSLELKLAENACLPVELIIQLSRHAFWSLQVAKTDPWRL